MKPPIREQVTGHVRGPVTHHASHVLLRYSSLVVALLAHVAVAEAQRATDQLSWLSGCWERRTTNGVVEEQWSSNTGGMLLGFGRTLRRDSLIEYEFMRIYPAGDTLVLEAQPSRQARAEFRAMPPFAPEVVFSNPAHDFPQRVIYRRSGDSLLARIEGTRGGQARVIHFPYVKASCPR
jgi:hypothetical protein